MSYYTYIKLDFNNLPLSDVEDLEEKEKKCNLKITEAENMIENLLDELVVYICTKEIKRVQMEFKILVSEYKELNSYYTLLSAIEDTKKGGEPIVYRNHFNYNDPEGQIDIAKDTLNYIRRKIIAYAATLDLVRKEKDSDITAASDDVVLAVNNWKDEISDAVSDMYDSQLYLNNPHKNEDDEDWKS